MLIITGLVSAALTRLKLGAAIDSTLELSPLPILVKVHESDKFYFERLNNKLNYLLGVFLYKILNGIYKYY